MTLRQIAMLSRASRYRVIRHRHAAIGDRRAAFLADAADYKEHLDGIKAS